MPRTPEPDERLPLEALTQDDVLGPVARVSEARERANGLDGREWTRNSISVWSDIRKTKDEKALSHLHPASFPEQLVSRAIACFMRPSDVILLDPFAGTG